jgi:hypothetical protein
VNRNTARDSWISRDKTESSLVAGERFQGVY